MLLTFESRCVILREKEKAKALEPERNWDRIRKPAEEIWPDAGSTSYDLVLIASYY